MYLSVLSMGLGRGMIGTFCNFMPRVSNRLAEAYLRHDMEAARVEQDRIHQVFRINAKYSKRQKRSIVPPVFNGQKNIGDFNSS